MTLTEPSNSGMQASRGFLSSGYKPTLSYCYENKRRKIMRMIGPMKSLLFDIRASLFLLDCFTPQKRVKKAKDLKETVTEANL